MTDDPFATIAAPCCCNDAEAEILRDLVTLGFDQREVCHLLWGDPTRASAEASAALQSRYSRLWIRRSMQAHFPWLRLPREA